MHPVDNNLECLSHASKPRGGVSVLKHNNTAEDQVPRGASLHVRTTGITMRAGQRPTTKARLPETILEHEIRIRAYDLCVQRGRQIAMRWKIGCGQVEVSGRLLTSGDFWNIRHNFSTYEALVSLRNSGVDQDEHNSTVKVTVANNNRWNG